MNIPIFTIWMTVLIVTGILSLTSHQNPSIAKTRLLVPVAGLAMVYVFEYLLKQKIKKRFGITIRRIFTIPFLILGFNWICIFTLTSYRSHHRPIIIPLSMVFIVFGLFLTHYNTLERQ
ncbi:MAG: hypothetical protein GY705_17980 [Bacteroidetes bacterium]|nr:hypothetical protein [Bacteroidota bacterium]